MLLEEFEITRGINEHQTASLERNDKTIDYTASKKLTYLDILCLSKGLSVISEFFDVNAIVVISETGLVSAALGKSLQEAIMSAIDSNPVDFLNSIVVASAEIDSDSAKILKQAKIIAGPKFTKNAAEYFENSDINYVTINTPLKDYKKFLSNEIRVTPLGTLTQTPNLSELDKETFKVISGTKPTVEQIEDAVFAWKIAKHANSQSIVIAKDLKTSAITEGMPSSSCEAALNYACEMAKEAVLASDMPISLHDVNAAVQCRIGLIIVPSASKEVLDAANKYNVALITTGVTNIKI